MFEFVLILKTTEDMLETHQLIKEITSSKVPTYTYMYIIADVRGNKETATCQHLEFVLQGKSAELNHETFLLKLENNLEGCNSFFFLNCEK